MTDNFSALLASEIGARMLSGRIAYVAPLTFGRGRIQIGNEIDVEDSW